MQNRCDKWFRDEHTIFKIVYECNLESGHTGNCVFTKRSQPGVTEEICRDCDNGVCFCDDCAGRCRVCGGTGKVEWVE